MQLLKKRKAIKLDTSNPYELLRMLGASSSLSIDHFTQICKRREPFPFGIVIFRPGYNNDLLGFNSVINSFTVRILEPFL